MPLLMKGNGERDLLKAGYGLANKSWHLDTSPLKEFKEEIQ